VAFELELSNDKSYVAFRPKARGNSLEEFVERIGAVGNFADEHGTTKILFDYREGNAPLHEDFFPAFRASPHLLTKGKWRAAILVSMEAPSYNIAVTHGIADLFNAWGQVAKHFYDYDKAIEWLV
jgi:hypothetical protein